MRGFAIFAHVFAPHIWKLDIKGTSVKFNNVKAAPLVLIILLVILLAFLARGKFSLGPLQGDFSQENSMLKAKIDELELKIEGYEKKVLELEKRNLLLSNETSILSTQPLASLEKEVQSFIDEYGDMKINGLNLSCDNPNTRKYRKMKRELTTLKVKAEQLGVIDDYFDFFNNDFSGLVSYGSC